MTSGLVAAAHVSSPSGALSCDQPYRSTPGVIGDGMIRFTAKARDGNLPPGLAADPVTGELSWTPMASQAGTYLVDLTATGPGGSAVLPIQLMVTCAPKGCGCASVDAFAPVSMLLAYVLTRRKRRG